MIILDILVSCFNETDHSIDDLVRQWSISATTICTLGIAEELFHTREGEDLTLKCRFNEQHKANEFSYYWARSAGANFENVAIGNIQLNTNYRLDFRPDRGIYDLQIKNASYGRDNGRFECRVKAVGTGADVHQEYYNLTVLTPPQPPLVARGAISIATENKKQELTCSSIGGSPDPTITWYREGSSVPLQAPTSKGGSKDHQTTSTLSMTPKREDDGAKFRCVVWNRAMAEGQRLETTVTLSVNYYRDTIPMRENIPAREEVSANSLPQDKAWLRVDTQTILTIQNHVITKNHRMVITHAEKRAWILKIRDVKESDMGWYMCQINTDPMKSQVGYLDVVVPPDILDYPTSTDMVVKEGSNVTLKCAATGSPTPTIQWRRENGEPITLSGGVEVDRLHMGAYLCIASNGIPPTISKRVMLIVHFPPMIWIQNQLVGAAIGQPRVTLDCQSEAFPKSINYWMRNDSIIIPSDRFIPETFENAYKVLMKLTILSVDIADLGLLYKCVAKNSLGDTDGAIKLYLLLKSTLDGYGDASETFVASRINELLDDFNQINFHHSKSNGSMSSYNSIVAEKLLEFHFVPSEEIRYGELFNIDQSFFTYDEYLYKVDTGSPTATESYVCLAELLDSNANICFVSSACSDIMSWKIQSYGYQLTHKLLYYTVLSQSNCMSNFPPYSSIQAIIALLCSHIFRESILIYKMEFPSDMNDLLLEQVLLCGFNGYAEFLDERWIENVLEWQSPTSGCYEYHSRECDREKRSMVILPDNCSDHSTGLAAATISMFTRILLLD